MFVYAEFDAPATGGGKLSGGGAKDAAGYLRFDAGADRTVETKLPGAMTGARVHLDIEAGKDLK